MTTSEHVELLMQGTEYGDRQLADRMAGELEERLVLARQEERPLRVYCGFDPRTADLHIGHTVPIRKLRQFQELGHHVIFLVGTYTSTIGDPSDQDRLRQILTREQAIENGRTYAAQAFRILDPERTEVRFNHEWLEGISFADLIEAASLFSLQQFLTREAFRSRWDRGDAVFLHETFYSLMQAWDAGHLEVDVQVGGTDQLFNIMTASRRFMSARGQRPNVAITLGILPGTDGSAKMSKSLDNHVPIMAPAVDMYGKIMSIPDHAMRPYFELATRLPPWDINTILGTLDTGAHPREVKMRLAREIVGVFHGPDQATAAEREFIRVFREGALPDDIPAYPVDRPARLLDVMTDSGLVPTRSEARRLIAQQGVRVDGRTADDPMATVGAGVILQVGKRRFRRLVAP
jgi:tyrosyl-tRNA synthetase